MCEDPSGACRFDIHRHGSVRVSLISLEGKCSCQLPSIGSVFVTASETIRRTVPSRMFVCTRVSDNALECHLISFRPLHLLILNAGVLHAQFKLTVDGFEEMFQVNYMAQAYLAAGLLSSMFNTKAKSPPRILAISCESHRVE